jgi:glycerol-3-phosphate acyltransferase PlsY
MGYLSVVLGYFIGSLPFGILMTQAVLGIDIRTVGSGATGSTNVARALGIGYGFINAILDISKGIVPVLIARAMGLSLDWQAATSFAAVLGHNWPIYAGFKGGKGIATSFGALLVLEPLSVLVVPIFVIIVAVTKIKSIASITAALLLIPLAFILREPLPVLLLTIAISLLAIYRHKENISRLLTGKENRVSYKLKPDKSLKQK